MRGFFRRFFRKHDSVEPAGVVSSSLHFPDSDDWYENDAGLPHPRWPVVSDWIIANVDADAFDEAYTQAVRLWMARMSRSIRGAPSTVESPHFVLFSTLQKTGRNWVLDILEGARRSIFEALGSLAWLEGWGKHVVIMLPPDPYTRYVSHFYPDGYMGRSAGVMLSGGGYAHIAVHLEAGTQNDHGTQRTLVHELTHHALQQLPLPRWLDEALAMHFEDQTSGGEIPLATRLSASYESVSTRALLDRFTEEWTEERIQGFWSGELWNSEEDEQSHCYELARILFRIIRQIVEGASDRFRAFIGEAHHKDAGESASHAHLGLSLGEIAGQFLGPGDWEPRPVLW